MTQAGALTIRRDPQHGLVTGTTLGGVTDTRTYNTFGELVSYRATVNGTDVWVVQYTRDAMGRILEKVETIEGVTDTYAYRYDPAGRLTHVEQNGVVVSAYGYDSNGNRLSHTTPAATTTGTYDAQDRLTQYGATTYTYTANGELESKSTGTDTTTYAYDVLGNLRAVILPDGTVISHGVDGQSRRIRQTRDGTPSRGWLYRDRLNPVAELREQVRKHCDGKIDAADATALMLLLALLQALLGMPPVPAPI